jgi:hypothetical protein
VLQATIPQKPHIPSVLSDVIPTPAKLPVTGNLASDLPCLVSPAGVNPDARTSREAPIMELFVLSVVDWIQLWNPERFVYVSAAIAGGSLVYLHVMSKVR